MRLFRSKPPTALTDDLATHLGRRPRVLARGTGPGVEVLTLVEALAVQRDGHWTIIEWHLVQSGGWRAERGRLEWRLADQSRDRVELSEPGRVPETFQERVNASIIIQQTYDAPGGGRVMIAGRRSLVPGRGDQEPVWQAVTQGGAKLSDPQVREFVLDTTARLRADYGF
ncbi:hypothetical protein [Aestuariimicrobium ganziense]|uniref:hypothetical protein n=1 Tax=Aestuariimicrobium ganziense TaxID=2773677 RepID=UPI001941DE31|nr:hypothetical protein [Aestuariimicrobium ganziense]